jgi:hypothetical protein
MATTDNLNGLLSSLNLAGYTGDAPNINETKFKKNIIHVLQSGIDPTMNRAMTENGTGSEKIRCSIMGKSTAKERTARETMIVPTGVTVTGAVNPSVHNLSNTWVAPRNMYDDRKINGQDNMSTTLDLKSNTITSIAMALARQRAKYFLEAAVGNAFRGPDESTLVAVPLPEVQKIPALDSGMTTGKVRRAKYLLDVADAPKENRYLFYAAEQLENMLSELEVTSRDYNMVNALNEGTLTKWLGFDWIPVSVDVLPTGESGGATTRKCVAYVKEVMTRAEWSTRMTIVQQIPLWFNDWLVLIQEYFNGARLLDNGVVQIECLEPLTTEWQAAQ